MSSMRGVALGSSSGLRASANKHLHPAALPLCCRPQLPAARWCCPLQLHAAQPLKFWSGTGTASSAPPCSCLSGLA